MFLVTRDWTIDVTGLDKDYHPLHFHVKMRRALTTSGLAEKGDRLIEITDIAYFQQLKLCL